MFLVIKKNFCKFKITRTIYSNSEMPEHFLKQLEVSQIQYIGSIIMSIGRNNWDVLLNKLENDTINTK